MILSERHKFVFIKGMKVAGTSVEMALSALCGSADIVTPISPIDERERLRAGGRCQNYASDRAAEADYLARLTSAPTEKLAAVQQPPLVFYNHMPLAEVVQKCGRPLAGYRIVAVERSPYAKVISWANMRLTYGSYRVGGGPMRADPSAIAAYVEQGIQSGQVAAVRNVGRYRWPDGRLAVQPMRYATLHADYEGFVRSLGMDSIPPLPHAKKGLLSDTLDPRNILRTEQIQRINALFAEEFDAFGYERI